MSLDDLVEALFFPNFIDLFVIHMIITFMGVVPILTFPDPILTVVRPLSHAFSVSSTLLASFENKVWLASLFFDPSFSPCLSSVFWRQ